MPSASGKIKGSVKIAAIWNTSVRRNEIAAETGPLLRSGLESEEILNLSTEKFIKRFKRTEELIINDGKVMRDLSAEEIDGYYNASKKD